MLSRPTAFDFDIILNEVKSTLPGADCIPHWFLRACASHFSAFLSKTVNHSHAALLFQQLGANLKLSLFQKLCPSLDHPMHLRPIRDFDPSLL
jgi:hypothetical protein